MRLAPVVVLPVFCTWLLEAVRLDRPPRASVYWIICWLTTSGYRSPFISIKSVSVFDVLVDKLPLAPPRPPNTLIPRV